jgi:CxxC motif-containing protein
MREMTCLECPRGCQLMIDEGTLEVTGNSCPRGAVYGENELRNPVRVVTSTVVLESESFRRLPVKTDRAIPKSKMFEVMAEIAKVRVHAPVRVGDVLIANVAGTDGNVVATRSVKE